MTKLIFAAIVVVLTVAGAEAMKWDHFRPSTNVIDLRERVAERPKPVTDLMARNWVLPPPSGGFWR